MRYSLKIFGTIVSIGTILSLSFLIWLHALNSYRNTVFHEGYERGVWHTVIYHKHMGKYPSQAWRDKAWKFVGADDTIGWIQAVENSKEGR